MTKFVDSFSEEVWDQTYRYNDEPTVDDTFRRIAKAISSIEVTQDKQLEWEGKFFELLSDFHGVPGGRIISNVGTEYSGTTLLNCFVSPRSGSDLDSLDQIINDLKNQAFTLKSEGGWGQNFSWIRPRGSFIHGIGVESPGAVKYMELYDKASEIITSGSGKKKLNQKGKKKIRKGAMMGILSCWHPDVVEGITAKQHQGRLSKFNISINCTNDFMDKVTGKDPNDSWNLVFPDTTFEKYKEEWDGDITEWKSKGYPIIVYQTVSAKWLWDTIMESTYNRAEPGVIFLDRANEWNTVYYNRRAKLIASNPCFSYYTPILTDNGYKNIGDLCDTEVSLVNCDGNVSKGKVWCSGEKEVYEYRLSNRKSIRCTHDHVFKDNEGVSSEIQYMVGKRLMPFCIGKTSPTNVESFKAGFILGDGEVHRLKSDSHRGLVVNIGNNDIDVANLFGFDGPGRHYSRDAMEIAIKYGLCSEIYENKVLPDSVDDDFMMGLYSANGCVLKDYNRVSFKTTSSNLALQILKWLKDNHSIEAYITTNKPKKIKFYNGTYLCAVSYDVNIGRYDDIVKFFEHISFIQRYKVDRITANLKRYAPKVISSKFIGTEKVYDFNEPLTNWGVINGVIAHNCGEQILPAGGVCDLGSMNLTQFIGPDGNFDFVKFKKYVSYMVRFLDNVNDYTLAPLTQYKDFLRDFRRIGVGVMGWGSLLVMMGIKFASQEASDLRDQIMETLRKTAYEASIDLADEKGMFPLCDPILHAAGKFVQSIGLSDEYMNKLRLYGIRNSSLISIQPNGNTGVYANVVSGGLEPIFSDIYTRTIIVNSTPDEIFHLTPKFYEGEWKETDLFKFAKEGDEDILRGEFNGTVYKIDRSRGLLKEVECKDYSVRYLESLGKWDRDALYIVPAHELTAEQHLNDLIGFMRYIDSSASKTINLPYEYPFESFKDIYLNAYKSGYVKGVTTYRSGTMAAVLSLNDTNGSSEEEEIILDTVKMNESSDATMKILRAEGRKWYMTVVWNEPKSRPFAIFVQTNHPEKTVTTNDAVDLLFELAEKKKIPVQYIDDVKNKVSGDINSRKITRALSLLLRHGVAIRDIVNTLNKVENVFIGSFLFQITKYLSTLIKDGEKVEGEKCSNCEMTGTLIYQEGCKVCSSCGSSKCG